jgi:hypothetical protein
MMENGHDAKPEEVRNALRWLVVSTIVLWTLVVILGVFAWTSSQSQRAALEKTATETASALCTFRHDLELRVISTENFLKENPDGIPGFPRASIQQSLDNVRRTVVALATLPCPPPELEGG